MCLYLSLNERAVIACTEAGSSLRLNRAVVAARLCGRLRRIVRSLQPNRAVDFFALTSQCEGIVRSLQELLPVGERIRFVGLLESP